MPRAAGRINENYARELMELHTLGVDGGSQQDVQELARVLTGVGISLRPLGDNHRARTCAATTCAKACSSSTPSATTGTPRRCCASPSVEAWPRWTRRCFGGTRPGHGTLHHPQDCAVHGG